MYIIIRTINSRNAIKRKLNQRMVNGKMTIVDTYSFQLIGTKRPERPRNIPKHKIPDIIRDKEGKTIFTNLPHEPSKAVLRSYRSKYNRHVGEKQMRKISAKAG